MERTPGQKLDDLFQICLIHLKMMEELIVSTDNGLRDRDEFKSKFILSAVKITEQYSNIKTLTDGFFAEGVSRFPPDASTDTVSPDTEKEVFTINC